jgi:hypothetical protein
MKPHEPPYTPALASPQTQLDTGGWFPLTFVHPKRMIAPRQRFIEWVDGGAYDDETRIGDLGSSA